MPAAPSHRFPLARWIAVPTALKSACISASAATGFSSTRPIPVSRAETGCVCRPGGSRACNARSDCEQLLGVALVELLLVRVGDRQAVGDLHLLGRELVGIVHRVHHALHAEDLLAEEDRRLPLHAARGVPEVFLQVIA